MQKCPKCGSENVDYKYHETPKNQLYDEMYCVDCYNKFNTPSKYQVRLDKVLSKFKRDEKLGYKVFTNRGETLVRYIHKKFIIFITNIPHYLSLDTVELLLRDLEA